VDGIAGGGWTRSRRDARAAARLPVNRVTRIRMFFPPNWDRNGAQALPQSNMVVLVDTEAGITGVGQGGSPDTVRNISRSVIGRNAFDTEIIWQAAFMDAHYSPGDERLHALGAIDLALWDIKGKALKSPLYELFGGKAREHIELYYTNGLPPGIVPPAEAAAMGLKERAAATMKAGWRVFRVDSGIMPSTGGARAGGPPPAAAGGRGVAPGGAPASPAAGGGRSGSLFNTRARIPQIIKALEQIREGVGPEGDS
jgi:galactonate dehydratase